MKMCVTHSYKANVCTRLHVCVCSLTDVMQFGSDSVVRGTLVRVIICIRDCSKEKHDLSTYSDPKHYLIT